MTRSEAITELYALFGAPHNADINLTRLNKLLDELTAELVRADEREACAKVCEELLERPSGYQGTWEGYGKFKTQMTGQECATAIRARSNT
jgi:hypothetical protein